MVQDPALWRSIYMREFPNSRELLSDITTQDVVLWFHHFKFRIVAIKVKIFQKIFEKTFCFFRIFKLFVYILFTDDQVYFGMCNENFRRRLDDKEDEEIKERINNQPLIFENTFSVLPDTRIINTHQD